MLPKRLALAPLLLRATNTHPGTLKTRFLKQQTRSATTSQEYKHAYSDKELEELSHALPASQIPGPRRWPFLGSHLAITKHKAYENSSEKIHLVWDAFFEEYGCIFRLDSPGQVPMVHVYLPEHVEKIVNESSEHSIRPFFDPITAVRNDRRTEKFVTGEPGILSGRGDEWLRVRRLVQGPALKMKTVRYYLPRVDKASLNFIEKMCGMLDEENELPENFLDFINLWALESLGLVIFGRQISCFEDSKEGYDMIQTVHEFMSSLRLATFEPFRLWQWMRTPLYRRFETAHNNILKYVEEAVAGSMTSLEQKVKDGEDLDLIETLLMTSDLRISDIYGFLIDFIVAGIDNTSATLAFTALNLARNPEKQALVQEELDRVLGKDVEVLSSSQLDRLSYLKATVKETLRINPVSFGIVRTLHKDMVLSGYRVPKGFNVFCLTKQTGMMEEHFPRANEFLPERWLRERPLGPINALSSIPFGLGQRMCIGRRFAEQEIYTLLARLFHKYNLEWKYGEVGTMMRLLLYPDKPLKFTMTRRF